MKRFIAGILSFAFVCMPFADVPKLYEQTAISASAATLENGLEYKISKNEAAIVGCDSSVTEVSIPEKLEGYPVTAIDRNAFAFCYDLTSVTIPDSVTSIGDRAFGYIWDKDERHDVPNPDFTMIGVPNSAAETYAKENNLSFMPLKTESSYDINGDGNVSIADAVLLSRCIAEDTTAVLSADALLNIDLDQDGMLTLLDVNAFLKKIAQSN